MSDEIFVKGTAKRYFSFHGGKPKTSHITLISHITLTTYTYHTYIYITYHISKTLTTHITLILHISHYNIQTYITLSYTSR